MIRALALLGLLALATPAGGAGPEDGLEPAPPGLDASSPLVAVTALLNQLNADLCSAAPGAPSGLFDAGEIARRALGRYHRDRTEGELAEFTELIGLRFQQWYAGVLARLAELRIGAGTIDGDWGIVPARISRSGSGRERGLIYRLHRTPGRRWLVYDVEINGRSRLRGFHGDFDRIILNEGYRELIDRVHKDVDRDARTQPVCAASLAGSDVQPVAGPDRAGGRRRGR